MPPLVISDQINTAALAGTWLGTVFTGIGLIALFAQFRAFLSEIRRSRRALMKRSCGDFLPLVPSRYMPDRGLVEAVAPSFLGWLQTAYTSDVVIKPTYDNRSGAGTSGWSQIFSHYGISPAQMTEFNVSVLPAVTGNPGPGSQKLTDLRFEDGRVAYGFSQNEFAALLVLGGFCISEFSLSGFSSSARMVGCLQVADDGPFSQVARFDPHEGCRDNIPDYERYASRVPVQRCIDYALGIIKTPRRGDRDFIIPPALANGEGGDRELAAWSEPPRAGQLAGIRYAMEQLVSISGADLQKHSADTRANREYDKAIMQQINPVGDSGGAKARRALLIAHALASLQPWDTIAVMPAHFPAAFLPILLPFVGSNDESVGVLQAKMVSMRLHPLGGWEDIEEQAMGLGQLGNIRVDFFTGNASSCRRYFQAMEQVLRACGVNLAYVRYTLAARGGADVPGGRGDGRGFRRQHASVSDECERAAQTKAGRGF